MKKELEKEDYQEKKKFLNQYYWKSRELDNLEEKLNRIIIEIEKIKTSKSTLMPRINGRKKTIEDLLSEKEKYQEKVTRKMIKIEKCKQNIEASIDTLENAKLKLILSYIYIENKTYTEIATEIDKTERHVRRLRDKAINLMKMVKKQ